MDSLDDISKNTGNYSKKRLILYNNKNNNIKKL